MKVCLRGGGRISSFVFLSRWPFGYYLPKESFGTIFAGMLSINGRLEVVVSKGLAHCHKGLTAHRCFLFLFCLSPLNAYTIYQPLNI